MTRRHRRSEKNRRSQHPKSYRRIGVVSVTEMPLDVQKLVAVEGSVLRDPHASTGCVLPAVPAHGETLRGRTKGFCAPTAISRCRHEIRAQMCHARHKKQQHMTWCRGKQQIIIQGCGNGGFVDPVLEFRYPRKASPSGNYAEDVDELEG